MQDYRLYVLDASGTLQFPQEFEASDDAQAVAEAEAHCADGQQMELWRGKRKIHCWGFDDCPSSCDDRPAAAA